MSGGAGLHGARAAWRARSHTWWSGCMCTSLPPAPLRASLTIPPPASQAGAAGPARALACGSKRFTVCTLHRTMPGAGKPPAADLRHQLLPAARHHRDRSCGYERLRGQHGALQANACMLARRTHSLHCAQAASGMRALRWRLRASAPPPRRCAPSRHRWQCVASTSCTLQAVSAVRHRQRRRSSACWNRSVLLRF